MVCICQGGFMVSAVALCGRVVNMEHLSSDDKSLLFKLHFQK